jgi:Icc-related predicted phosphoesterase
MRFFNKRPPRPTTRVFFATDLHGSERTFRKFLNAGQFYEADVLVMGGDILGQLAIPIIREGGGRYRATLQGRTEQATTAAELSQLQERIGLLGGYSQVMDEDEFRALQADPAAVDRLFHRLARERLEAWLDLAETRLAGTGLRCYISGGNDDYPDVLEALERAGAAAVFSCEGRVQPLDDTHTMISLGFSAPTPWHTPREVTDEQLGHMIGELVAQVPDVARCVFNFHVPPVDSTLDTTLKFDWSTDPPVQLLEGGQVVLFGAGSQAVRQAVEVHQPLLGLHGHIHESPGAVRIGRTLCVNPGSEYGEGILRGCVVDLSGGQVQAYELTTG